MACVAGAAASLLPRHTDVDAAPSSTTKLRDLRAVYLILSRYPAVLTGGRMDAEMWARCSAALITAVTVAIVSVAARRAASAHVVADLQVRLRLQPELRHLSLSFCLLFRLYLISSRFVSSSTVWIVSSSSFRNLNLKFICVISVISW